MRGVRHCELSEGSAAYPPDWRAVARRRRESPKQWLHDRSYDYERVE